MGTQNLHFLGVITHILGVLKPSFFMVLGSKGGGNSYFLMFTPENWGRFEDGSIFDEHILLKWVNSTTN